MIPISAVFIMYLLFGLANVGSRSSGANVMIGVAVMVMVFGGAILNV